MTYEAALNQNIKLSPIQARNDLERYLLRDEKPIPKAVAMGMQALEKQIPKKAINKFGKHDFVTYGRCSECNNTVSSLNHYCGRCGQALEW